MPTQKHLRLNYRPCRFIQLGLLGLLLVYSGSLFLMPLALTPYLIFQIVGLVGFYVELKKLRRQSLSVLRYDGEHWWLYDVHGASEACCSVLHRSSYISTTFMRLVFYPAFAPQQSMQKKTVYFSRDNCTESEYRSLCRLLL